MTTNLGELRPKERFGWHEGKNLRFRGKKQKLRRIREDRESVERPRRMGTVPVVNPRMIVGSTRHGDAVRVSVDERRDFVVVLLAVIVIPGLVHMLEGPHVKGQKENQASLQSSKTTKHQGIMPYARASFNRESQTVALIDNSPMFCILGFLANVCRVELDRNSRLACPITYVAASYG